MWINSNFRDATIDRTRQSLFLFEIKVQGATRYYSTADVTVESTTSTNPVTLPFKGYVQRHGTLSHNMRMSTGLMVSSNSNMSVTLDPSAKLRDLVVADNIVLTGVTCYVYRWIDGLTLEDCPALLKGRLENFSVSPDGSESFTIVSWDNNFKHGLHPVTVNEEVNPDHADNAGGKPHPAIYGTALAYPMPITEAYANTGTHTTYMMAGQTLLTADVNTYITNSKDRYWQDNDFVNAVATPTVEIGTDTLGNPYSRLKYSADYDDLIMTMNAKGWRDNARGDYTRKPNAIITNPVAIVAHSLITYSDYEWPEDIDRKGLMSARSERRGWKFKAALIEEINLDDFVSSILREAFCVGFYGPDGFTIMPINIDADPIIGFAQGLNMENFSWSEGDFNSVAHEFRLNFGYRYVDGNFSRKGVASDIENHGVPFFDAQCARARDRYGKREPMVIDSLYIDDRHTASRLGKLIVDYFTVLRKEVSFTTTWDYGYLQLGDMMSITHDLGAGGGWTQKRFFISGISYGTDTIKIKGIEA